MKSTLSVEEWERIYRPISNPRELTRRTFGPTQDEIDVVLRHDPNFVWSQVWDFYEEQLLIQPGFMPPDGCADDLYFITEVPWTDESTTVFLES